MNKKKCIWTADDIFLIPWIYIIRVTHVGIWEYTSTIYMSWYTFRFCRFSRIYNIYIYIYMWRIELDTVLIWMQEINIEFSFKLTNENSSFMNPEDVNGSQSVSAKYV